MSRLSAVWGLPSEPIFNFFAHMVRGETVAPMQHLFEARSPPSYFLQIIIGKFAPLLSYASFESCPVFLDLVPVHLSLLLPGRRPPRFNFGAKMQD